MLSFSRSSLSRRDRIRAAAGAVANSLDNEPLTRGGRDPRDRKPSHIMPAPPHPHPPPSSSPPPSSPPPPPLPPTPATQPRDDRSAATPLLPEIQPETTRPFSALFGSSFDMATVESTAQLADNSIFITSTGSRFRLQRIDTDPPQPPAAVPSLPSYSPAQRHAFDGRSISENTTSQTRTSQFSGSSSERNTPTPNPQNAADRLGNLDHVREIEFGAAALYINSDGGAQAAEILTDSESAGRLIHGGGGGDSPSELSPQPRTIPAVGSSDSATPTCLGRSSASRSDEYLNPSLPNSDHFSLPAYAPSSTPSARSGNEKVSASASALSPPLPSLMEFSSPVVADAPLSPLTRAPSPSTLSPTTSVRTGSIAPTTSDSGERYGYYYDTQTPIVVGPDDEQPPPRPPVPQPPPAPASSLSPSGTAPYTQTIDGSSVTRDNVLPGEEVLYDGAVKSAHALTGPFEDGRLKVFRNNLNHDLRFHCKVGNNTETHWMKGDKAKLVPVYAYDQRSGYTVFIRDGDDTVRQRHGSVVSRASHSNAAPSAIYKFEAMQDLFGFQSQLTGESVVLDISSVKWIRLARANSRSSEMYSSVRLQIWHEPRSRRATQSDVASFVTAGTALSGPLRDRTTPNMSRLVVFLGRSEEYVTAFITDDIEMEPRGRTSARLKPRKYGGIHKRSTRPGIRARLEAKSGPDPASLDIHGEPYSPDVEQSFDLYKTFEIEFENEASQINFCASWNEVILSRRNQRERLRRIQEEMRRETFSPREALSILT